MEVFGTTYTLLPVTPATIVVCSSLCLVIQYDLRNLRH